MARTTSPHHLMHQVLGIIWEDQTRLSPSFGPYSGMEVLHIAAQLDPHLRPDDHELLHLLDRLMVRNYIMEAASISTAVTYQLTKEGGKAYVEETLLHEARDQRSATWQRRWSYWSIPISVMAAVVAIWQACDTRDLRDMEERQRVLENRMDSLEGRMGTRRPG